MEESGGIISGLASGISNASPAGAIASAVSGAIDSIGNTIQAVVGEKEESHRAYIDWLSLRTSLDAKESSEINSLIGKSISGGHSYVTMVIILLIICGLFIMLFVKRKKA